jgi:hypothetical protein
MTWSLRAPGNQKLELTISDEPDYIHALEMAPESRESQLDSGTWLIVVFPIWSSPVRESVREAIACAKDYGGRFQLGIRPYNLHEELDRWWPGNEAPSAAKLLVTVQDEAPQREIHITSDPSSNPMWLLLRDGQVIHHGTGPRSKAQLSELMHTALD